jgi:hypothetical protein
MTLFLVLDENIIMLAAKVKDDSDNDDPTCSILLGDIYKKKDILKCSDELYNNYLRILKELERTIPSSVYTRKMLMNLIASDQIEFEPYIPVLSEENQLPPDDIYIVRLVVRTRSNLVSTDNGLRNSMESANIMSKYDVSFMKPHEVYPN